MNNIQQMISLASLTLAEQIEVLQYITSKLTAANVYKAANNLAENVKETI